LMLKGSNADSIKSESIRGDMSWINQRTTS
jgi:hypothetical protein